jgi:predicted flavoprotein YhiN
MIKKDVIIIGAGASGMMCAIGAGKRGRSVLVLDHADKIGKKIRISGGGSCNFANLNVNHTNFISNNPHFCKSALSRLKPDDFIALLEKHGVQCEEREEGQLFCSESSDEIIRMLEKEMNDAGVNIILNCHILFVKKDDSFILSTDHGIFESESLVISTLKVTELRPALVPFVFSRKDLKIFGELRGISIDAAIKCNKMEFRGSILFTHRGLSGPAILQISSYWKQGDSIVIDMLPGIDIYGIFIERQKNKSKVDMHNLLSEFLPSRLAKIWCTFNIQSKPVNQYNEKELKKIAHQIHNWEIEPQFTEDYRTAEVTLGGIDTDELSSKTMGSKKIKGLYFTGEVIDVTGQLGGYNLHWAWASGFVAGQYA